MAVTVPRSVQIGVDQHRPSFRIHVWRRLQSADAGEYPGKDASGDQSFDHRKTAVLSDAVESLHDSFLSAMDRRQPHTKTLFRRA